MCWRPAYTSGANDGGGDPVYAVGEIKQCQWAWVNVTYCPDIKLRACPPPM